MLKTGLFHKSKKNIEEAVYIYKNVENISKW